MPVKKRTAKRRVGTQEEAQAWEAVFSSGMDLLQTLPGIGVVTEDLMPDPQEAEDAWRRLGHLFLVSEHYRFHVSHGRPDDWFWAIKTFGLPA